MPEKSEMPDDERIGDATAEPRPYPQGFNHQGTPPTPASDRDPLPPGVMCRCINGHHNHGPQPSGRQEVRMSMTKANQETMARVAHQLGLTARQLQALLLTGRWRRLGDNPEVHADLVELAATYQPDYQGEPDP
jgi:hypothetical protein